MASTPPATFTNQRTDITTFALRHIMTVTDTHLETMNLAARAVLISSVFGVSDGPQFVVNFYPNGIDEKSEDFISLALRLHSTGQTSDMLSRTTFRFSLLNDDSEMVYTNSSKFWRWTSESGINVVRSANFLRKNYSSAFKFREALHVCCEIAIGISEDVMNPHPNTDQYYPYPVPKCTLSSDFLSMFNDQKSGDTIIEVESEKFLVHRKILEVRSRDFAKTIEQGRLVINNATSSTIKEMLTYIYTGTSPNLKDLARDMFVIANRYKLERLKFMSEKALAVNLTNENAIEVLLLAELHHAINLKEFVIKFIVRNGDHFLQLDAWRNIVRTLLLEHPNVIADVSVALYSWGRGKLARRQNN